MYIQFKYLVENFIKIDCFKKIYGEIQNISRFPLFGFITHCFVNKATCHIKYRYSIDNSARYWYIPSWSSGLTVRTCNPEVVSSILAQGKYFNCKTFNCE